MKKITIVVDKNGKMAVDLDGFSGDDCLAEAKRLAEKVREGGLDVSIEGLERKPDNGTKERQKEKVGA